MSGRDEEGPHMTFSYSAVWDDTIKLTRQHLSLLIAIAGVFIFLPQLMLAVFLPPPEPQSADPARVVQIVMDYYRAAAPWYLLGGVVSMVGTAAMLRLVFARGSTVGAAIAFALALLPFYFLLQLLNGLIVVVGFICLIVPGLYLFGRIAPAAALMVAEQRRNPIDVIRRTFAITKGRGWAVFGLLFIVGIVGGITISVARTLFGLIFLLAAGRDLGTLLTSIVAAALSAAFATLFVMLYAAIYRALTASDSVAATFE
jgi:hypothetical protein